ncbi:MAG: phage tail protein, partial [Pseudomonadota bacterium]
MSLASHAPYLAPPPRPPHDPLRLPLSARQGWRLVTLADAEVHPASGALALAPVAPPGPSLTDSRGAFGGVVLPRLAATDGDRGYWILHPHDHSLHRFDPCTCAFEQVPCVGGNGEGPREFSAPGGLVIGHGNLYVADTANARVQVFALHGMVLRALWSLPLGTGLAAPFTPTDVAIDGRGQVLVGDAANGGVHVFNRAGCWLRFFGGLGAVQALAVDGEDRVYVLASGLDHIVVMDGLTGERLETVTRADALVGRFPALPIAIDADLNLQLGTLCQPPTTQWFDLLGTALDRPEGIGAGQYPVSGQVLIGPLDSRLYECVWDRISIVSSTPQGTRLTVESHSSATPLSDAEILNLRPEEAPWTPCLSVDSAGPENTHDGLLRSPAGRYLWLRLTLHGDALQTPHVHAVTLDYPRISLTEQLPAVFSQDPASADFTRRFLAIMDRTQRDIEGTLDHQARLFDPLATPTGRGDHDFLTWLASWVGVTLERSLPEARRRMLLKEAPRLFSRRGTLDGLRGMLTLFLGWPSRWPAAPASVGCAPCTTAPAPDYPVPPLVLEHFRLRRWLFLGAGRLGDQARLWGQRIVNRSQLGGPTVQGNARTLRLASSSRERWENAIIEHFVPL